MRSDRTTRTSWSGMTMLAPFRKVIAMSGRQTLPADEAEARHDADLDALQRRLASQNPPEPVADIVMLRPADCPQHMPAAEHYPLPDAASCQDLIDEIAADGGNREPVLVRAHSNPAGPRFTLLVGARRHFAVDWLNHNGRPELRLRAQVVAISDEEAFRMGEQRNRARNDISELARARAYRDALNLFYDGVQSHMASALGASSSHLSRLLALADMPEQIISAFGRLEDLKVRHAEILAPLLRREPSRHQIIDEAGQIDREQQSLSASGLPLLPAALVLSRLKAAGGRDAQASIAAASIRHNGLDVGSIWQNADGALQLGATLPAGVSTEDVMQAVEEGLRALRG